MKEATAYLPKDAIANHRDFDVYYADGTIFLSFQGAWQHEEDEVAVFGRMGGEMGRIKPDHKALVYYLRLERWEYALHTLHLFKCYYVNGMKWKVEGSLANTPFFFVDEQTGSKEGRASDARLEGRGACWEIATKDPATLRIAVTACVAMGIKEEYRGLSEGLRAERAHGLHRLRDWIFSEKGIRYEDLPDFEALQADALGSSKRP